MAKKRVSLTVEEELVERIDSEASGEDLNRSQMVEEIVESYFSRQSIDTAVVLCGDPELRSLDERDGRPVIEHILEHLQQQGFRRALLLVGRNTELREELGAAFDGLKLEYISEEQPRGTAAALRKAEGLIEGAFAVLNGHVITDVDFDEMAEVHREEDSVATMALTTVEDPSRYGVARLKGSRILGFEEKPEEGEEPSRLINAGSYLFDQEIFERLEEDSLEEVFEKLASRGELSGYIYGGEWIDVAEV
ncbi:MAG: sugar phosphate nucleotidyltransferase [Candidatus Nanohaloarchaea archaeon]